MKKIAIIGSGISGLGCAYALRDQYQLTLFEAHTQLGGHANTVDVDLDGLCYGVDTGFLVYNERTYPHLIQLFADLKVKVAPSEMSFSLSRRDVDREWCGSSVSSLFAQPSNLLSIRFWSMLKDIFRFNREATRLAKHQAVRHADSSALAELDEPLADYLKRMRYGKAFSEDYLLPMAAAIWSCPTATMGSFPMGSFVRFFHNHGLLQVSNRPQWYTCEGGSRNYVNAMSALLRQTGHTIQLNTPVKRVVRTDKHVEINTGAGLERFDAVVMACHSDEALTLLDAPSALERKVLSSIRYQENTAYLHTDASLMPKRKKAWAAWNYLSDRGATDSAHTQVSVTYWLNRLQPLPFQSQLFVSLNPVKMPEAASVLKKMTYAHPVFDAAANLAQPLVPQLQGQQRTWYAGAWCGYGFHEDGLRSGLTAASLLQASFNHADRPTLVQAMAA
jgi:uncharacterized protein